LVPLSLPRHLIVPLHLASPTEPRRVLSFRRNQGVESKASRVPVLSAVYNELLEVCHKDILLMGTRSPGCQMMRQRIAQTPFLCLVLLWTTTLIAVANAAPKISTEILNFVPSCAQTCFQSFILTNLDSSGCGDSPTLACLCRQSGKTGHTIGEGAVACIAAESARGSCKGSDSSSEYTHWDCGNQTLTTNGQSQPSRHHITCVWVSPTLHPRRTRPSWRLWSYQRGRGL